MAAVVSSFLASKPIVERGLILKRQENPVRIRRPAVHAKTADLSIRRR
jgi:hypothetical protein